MLNARKKQGLKSLFKEQTPLCSLSFVSLLIPLLFESLTAQLLGTANSVVLSGYSENAAAAVGAATPIVNLIYLVGSTISLGASVLISNLLGEGKPNETRKVCFAGLICCTVAVSAVSLPLSIFAESIMSAQNLSGEIADFASVYFKFAALSAPLYGTTVFLLSVMRCYGHTVYTFIVSVARGALSLFGSLFFIYSPISPLGGIVGVGVSLALAISVSLFITVLVFIRKRIGIDLVRSPRSLIFCIGKILKIGLPSAISSGSFTLSQVITTSFVALIDGPAITAKVFFTNVLSYSYLFSYACGSAAAIITGIRHGAGKHREADEMLRVLRRITVTANLILSLSIFLLRRPILSMFTSSEEIILLSSAIFLVDALTEHGRAVSHVYEQSLRACTDVWFVMIATVISCWTLSIGLAYVFSITFNMGLLGCYVGLMADELMRGVITRIRWHFIIKKQSIKDGKRL